MIHHVRKALLAGAYLETAVAQLGVTKATLHVWLRRGARARSGIHRDFIDAIEKGVAEAELRDVARIDQAVKLHWQAAAWKLERRHPKRWAATHRIRLETEKQVDAILEKLTAKLPPAVLRQVLDALGGIAAEIDSEGTPEATAGNDETEPE